MRIAPASRAVSPPFFAENLAQLELRFSFSPSRRRCGCRAPGDPSDGTDQETGEGDRMGANKRARTEWCARVMKLR